MGGARATVKHPRTPPAREPELDWRVPPRTYELSEETMCGGQRCITDEEIYAPLYERDAESVREAQIEEYFGWLHDHLNKIRLRERDNPYADQVFVVYRDILVELEVAARTGHSRIDINGLWKRARHFDWDWEHRGWMLQSGFADHGPFGGMQILGVDPVAIFDAAIRDQKPDPAWWERAIEQTLETAFLLAITLPSGPEGLALSGERGLATAEMSAARVEESLTLGGRTVESITAEERLVQIELMVRQEGVQGAAFSPRVTWRPNPPGTPLRTLDEALEIAGKHVDIDAEYFQFRLDSSLPDDVGAQYLDLRDFDSGRPRTVSWDDVAPGGEHISIRVNPKILASDEEIIATFAHEMHEIELLEEAFATTGERMPASKLRSLIDARGVLHSQAWDFADALIQSLRETPP
jgi:hypothetical protein